jgi:hypothetical protein
MKSSEVNPLVFWGVLGVVVLIAIGVGFLFLGGGGDQSGDQSGTAEVIQQIQETGTFYQPPAGAPVPGAPR